MAIQEKSDTLVMNLSDEAKNTLERLITAGMLKDAKDMNSADGNQLLKGNKQTHLEGPIIPEKAGAEFFDKVDSKNKTTLS